MVSSMLGINDRAPPRGSVTETRASSGDVEEVSSEGQERSTEDGEAGRFEVEGMGKSEVG